MSEILMTETYYPGPDEPLYCEGCGLPVPICECSEQVCEVCEYALPDCICDPCPICGEKGNPDCYTPGGHFDEASDYGARVAGGDCWSDYHQWEEEVLAGS
jgi:hypothetical protein